MTHLRPESVLAAAAILAAILLVGGPLVALTQEEEFTGKVMALEKGKSLTVESSGLQREFRITEKTEIKGDLAVGRMVRITVLGGAATRIFVQ